MRCALAPQPFPAPLVEPKNQGQLVEHIFWIERLLSTNVGHEGHIFYSARFFLVSPIVCIFSKVQCQTQTTYEGAIVLFFDPL